jgi:membrane peptidoglycan carboxypeptidase
MIRRVEDRNGEVLFTTEPSVAPAISETTAFLMASMLADVINAGTGARARGLGFTLPAAGKTGTTNEFHDAWFVGFTPSLVTGVWVGFDQPKTIFPDAFAGEVAVPMWAGFMKAATKGDKPQWLRAPNGLTTASVCRLSGQLARPACEHAEVVGEDGRIEHRSAVYTEYFVRGTEPTVECTLHQPRSVLGAIAAVFGGGGGGEEREASPAPPPTAVEAGLPAPGAPAAVEAAAGAPSVVEAPPAPEKPKKRGFWSRFFGRRERGDDRSKDEQDPTGGQEPGNEQESKNK